MISRAIFVSSVTIIAFYATGSAMWHYRCTQQQQQQQQQKRTINLHDYRHPPHHELRRRMTIASLKSCVEYQNNYPTCTTDDADAAVVDNSSRQLSEDDKLVSIGKYKIDLNDEYLNIRLQYWILVCCIVIGLLLVVSCCCCRYCCIIKKRKNKVKSDTSSTQADSSDEKDTRSKSDSKNVNTSNNNNQNFDDVVDYSKERYFNNRKLPWWSNTSSPVSPAQDA